MEETFANIDLEYIVIQMIQSIGKLLSASEDYLLAVAK